MVLLVFSSLWEHKDVILVIFALFLPEKTHRVPALVALRCAQECLEFLAVPDNLIEPWLEDKLTHRHI